MLLTRYTLLTFRRFFLLALAAFSGLYLLIEFFDKIDNFTKYHATFAQYLLYFSCKLPLIITQVIPLAVLLGVFLTVGEFSRHNELTAMRAGGMSLTHIGLPLLGVGFFISFIILVTGEWVVPLTSHVSNQVYDIELATAGNRPIMSRDKLWLRDGDAIVNIRLALPDQKLLQGVTIQEIDEQYRPLQRLDADKATFQDNGWMGEKVTVTRFDAESGEITGVTQQTTTLLPLSKTPEEFNAAVDRKEEMNIADLTRLAKKVRAEGYDPTRYLIDRQGRIATPFASFIMAFLGIPFALQRGRGSSLAAGIAVSIAIGIIYHLFQGTMLAFGYSGAIPVLVAAWSPNLIFGIFGLYLLKRAH